MRTRNPQIIGDTLYFVDAHSRTLELRRTDRLSAMDERRLMQFWLCSYYFPRVLGAFLFPDRPRGYQSAAGELGGYASNRATALACSDRPEVAAGYQRIADDLCRDRLPAFARMIVDGAALPASAQEVL